MKKLIALLGLIFCTYSHAATGSGNVSNVIQAGMGNAGNSVPTFTVPFGSLTNVVSISMGSASNINGGYYGFVNLASGGGQYKVPTGKTLYCFDIKMSTSANAGVVMGYATATFSDGIAGPLTGQVNYSNAAGAGGTPMTLNFPLSQSFYSSLPIFMSFPQNTYPFLQPSLASSSQIFAIMDCYIQ